MIKKETFLDTIQMNHLRRKCARSSRARSLGSTILTRTNVGLDTLGSRETNILPANISAVS